MAKSKPDKERSKRQQALEEFEAAKAEAQSKRDKHKLREVRKKARADGRYASDLRERMREDLRRVYEDPRNPYRRFAASRDRYRDLGHYPEPLVADLFGTHAEFLRSAGLKDSRTTNKARRAIANVEAERRISEYAKTNLTRHYGKWSKRRKDQRQQGKPLRVVGFSDLHSLYLDPFAWEVAKSVLKDVQPDLVVLNGDVVDFPKLGRYTQMPGVSNFNVWDEIVFTRNQIFKPIREIVGDGVPITWHIGNHDQRLIRYIADGAPALHDIPFLDFDKLFAVEEYGIELVFGGHFLAPSQKDRDNNIRKTYKVYYDTLAATHGHPDGGRADGANAADRLLRRFGYSGFSGHTHKPMIYTMPTEINPHANWTCLGMMSSHAVAQNYNHDPTQYTMGFGVFEVLPASKIVSPNLALIFPDNAFFGGSHFTPTKKAIRRRESMYS